MIGVLLGVALAQEPAAAPPSEDPYEVVVWGESQIRAARRDVIRAFQAQGWRLRERGGDYVFAPPAAWMGRARLTREGTLVFGRPVLAVGRVGAMSMPLEGYDAEATLERRGAPSAAPTVSFHVLPANRLLQQARADVLATVDPALDGYAEAMASTRFAEALDALPGRLDRLWAEGLAFDGFTVLPTKAERRAAVVELWASRAATPEGERIRAAVRAWLAATVQTSADPLTADEIAAAEARAGRRLAL